MSTPVSTIKLNNIPLDIDPDDLVLIDGRRRGSVHRIIGGGTVYQDRGADPTDMLVTLTGNLVNLTTLQALYALYRKTALEFQFEDFKGNKFQVVFTPGERSFVAKPLRGSGMGWSYQISLSVVSITAWLGVTSGYPATT
jgi:hypothetical protein